MSVLLLVPQQEVPGTSAFSTPLPETLHDETGDCQGRAELLGAWAEARLNLGRRMWQAGIDDGSIGRQIDRLDSRIRLAEAARTSTQTLETARNALLLRLANLALEDDAPLPGADAEYRAA